MKEKLSRLQKEVFKCKLLYLMILPGFLAVFIFQYLPIGGVSIAFKDFKLSKGIWDSEWVGLKNFVRFIKYPYFTQILVNTLRIGLVSLCISFPAEIIFSLMLNEMKNLRLKRICQQIVYAPYFISTVLVCSMTIIFLNRDGLFDIIIKQFGGESQNFMSSPAAFPYIYALSGLWSSLGWGTILYLSSLSGVSPELVEAAKLDGAGRFGVIWHVNLPHIRPTIMTLLIMNIGSILNVGFEKTLLLQNTLNLESSSIISTYSYEIGILQQQFSYSTAIGLFNTLINVLLVSAANLVSKKLTNVGLW